MKDIPPSPEMLGCLVVPRKAEESCLTADLFVPQTNSPFEGSLQVLVKTCRRLRPRAGVAHILPLLGIMATT